MNWKYFAVSELVAVKRTVGFTKSTQVRNLGDILRSIGCRWQYHAKKTGGETGREREREIFLQI